MTDSTAAAIAAPKTDIRVPDMASLASLVDLMV
jgi:hypothetical protein